MGVALGVAVGAAVGIKVAVGCTGVGVNGEIEGVIERSGPAVGSTNWLP
jgi:hypothetical protein